MKFINTTLKKYVHILTYITTVIIFKAASAKLISLAIAFVICFAPIPQKALHQSIGVFQHLQIIPYFNGYFIPFANGENPPDCPRALQATSPMKY